MPKVTTLNKKGTFIFLKLLELSYSKLVTDNNQTIVVLGQLKSCIWSISLTEEC